MQLYALCGKGLVISIARLRVCAQFIVPVATDNLYDREDPLNYVFRIILPIFFVVFCAIGTRLAPIDLDRRAHDSMGFDKSGGDVNFTPVQPMMMHAPMPGAMHMAMNPLAQP